MIAALALTLAVTSATHLTVAPWTGGDLTTSAKTAAKFRLTVQGKPNQTIDLVASGTSDGWLAAFCTPTVCSPGRVTVTIPSSGKAVFQFELIRESDDAPHSCGARITAGDTSIAVPPVSR